MSRAVARESRHHRQKGSDDGIDHPSAGSRMRPRAKLFRAVFSRNLLFSLWGDSVFELTDGKIRRYTEYWDAYAFLVQLGALPAPGTAPATPMP